MKRKAKLPFDPKAFLSKVNGGRAIADYQKDQNVYKQGDPADSVFYIESGKVKKTVISEQGKEAVVAILGTGDFFGEGCLTGKPLRLSTVSAMTECVIMRITKADITRVIHDEPATDWNRIFAMQRRSTCPLPQHPLRNGRLNQTRRVCHHAC